MLILVLTTNGPRHQLDETELLQLAQRAYERGGRTTWRARMDDVYADVDIRTKFVSACFGSEAGTLFEGTIWRQDKPGTKITFLVPWRHLSNYSPSN